jgi:hypothetical protein
MRYISNPRSLNCGRDKEIYDDLYEFADNWCYTTKWTKADVENKLNRTKRMYGINDSELNKVLAKVNKDFKRKKSAKTDPYSDAAYKTSAVNSSRRRLNCGESYGWIVDASEAQEAYDFACEAFGKDTVDSDIVGTLSSDELSDALAYLFRMWDFEEWEKYKNGEDY